MISINITGNLGADAKEETFNERKQITFRMCSTRRSKDGDAPTWFNVVYRDSPNMLPHLIKGTSVHVCGSLVAKAYMHDNQPTPSLTVYATDVSFVGARQNAQQQQQTVPQAQDQQLFPSQQEQENDLPF